MKSTGRSRHQERSRESRIDRGALPGGASAGIAPDGIGPDAWAELVSRARDCQADAQRDLRVWLGDFRRCFTGHLFADPEAAYGEFVGELVDQIRYGILPDPRSLLAQARAMAMRKTAGRIRCLAAAARVLGSLPKRYRETLIRAQLAPGQSAPAPVNGTGALARQAG